MIIKNTLIFLIVCLSGCARYSSISDKFEKFDQAAFNKLIKRDSILNLEKLKDTNRYRQSGPVVPLETDREYYRFQDTDSHGRVTEEVLKSYGQTYWNIYLNDYLMITKDYYPNGFIMKKRTTSWLGFSVGMSYTYDPQGRLVKAIDNDKGYNFNYVKVLKFCAKKNIPVEKLDSGPRFTIIKGKDAKDGSLNWYISAPDINNSKYNIYVLDGMSGKLKKTAIKPIVVDGF